MTMFSLFVVDDEDIAREGVALALKKQYQVKCYANAEEALDAMAVQPPDLVLLDIGLPGMSGTEALEIIKSRYPDTIVIMITAFEDVQTVVAAMKSGAYEYMVKPLDMNALIIAVRNALETVGLKKEIRELQQTYVEKSLPTYISQSHAMEKIMETVQTVAQSPDTPVLILGETGTGKELIAQVLHYRSPNFRGALVAVNCAAIPKDLIESELFGYEKGAFSGAGASGKEGLVEKAADGTLFLDEVADLSAEAQAKLLRFLESGEYFRVGGTHVHRVKTRIVSATNKDLAALANEGRFRRDLYFRLAVVTIEVPSLNERREDISLLANYFLDRFSKKFRKSFSGLAPDAVHALEHFHWAGNVRELRNVIERAVLLGKGNLLSATQLGLEISTDLLLPSVDDQSCALPVLSSDGVDLPAIIDTIEKHYFERALELTGGNESLAAKLLNLSRDKFRYRRLKS
jgi:two-component system response regulator AtoC